jgi:hypothetical protein
MSDDGLNTLREIAAEAAALLPVDDGKEPCPECGKRYMPAGMGVHRAAKHGYHGGKRISRRPPSNEVVRGPGRPRKIDLTVDDVFDAVVNQMFPRGSIPVAALTPLLRWRHATDEMLIEVLHGGNE